MTTINRSNLRKSQEDNLKGHPSSPRGRSFANSLPPIELDDLAVAALVQDDADHNIWHAVQIPVKAENP